MCLCALGKQQADSVDIGSDKHMKFSFAESTIGLPQSVLPIVTGKDSPVELFHITWSF